MSSFFPRIRERLPSRKENQEGEVVETAKNEEPVPEVVIVPEPTVNEEEPEPIANEEPVAAEENVEEDKASTIPEEPEPSRFRDDLYIQTRSNSSLL
jgi:hypothetical protein